MRSFLAVVLVCLLGITLGVGAAVQPYPNSALHRAKLAEAQLAAGDLAAFRREAEIALRLDKTTPHIDKKLPPELRNDLARGLRQE